MLCYWLLIFVENYFVVDVNFNKLFYKINVYGCIVRDVKYLCLVIELLININFLENG